MWVKICGTTSLEDAEMAVEAGADALGFVFAPSPRRVTPAQVAPIVSRLPGEVERIGVFVNPEYDEIVEAVREAGLTGVQLHVCADLRLPERLRERFLDRSNFRLLQVVRIAMGERFTSAGLPEIVSRPDAVLVEARSSAGHGGTGSRFNWPAARELFHKAAHEARLIVAGGLTPENVAEAVETLRPWGVDVVTGVESEPGQKDPAKVLAFVRNARHAANSFPPAKASAV